MKVGFVSFRIAGTDGVSLEAERWRTILTRMGHEVTFVAGELDRSGLLIPELHFFHPDVVRAHQMVVDNNVNYKKIEKEIFAMAGVIEGKLREQFRRFKFEKLVVANAFSLPMHFPLAVALERVIAEYRIPTVSRNHDFWWERPRYLKSHCFEFFKRWFPPANPLITHVTINSLAQKELKFRRGLESTVVWDSFDFAGRAKKQDAYSGHFREDFGLGKKDIIFLQATRIVQRKQIELAVELVEKLNDSRVVLVLAGRDGDESGDYLQKIKRLAKKAGIRHKFIEKWVNGTRKIKEGKRVYTLWDCFANCDWVTYPSETEGFGNQFVEAVYFKKPIVVNRYPVYKADIEPLGFETVTINGKIARGQIDKTRRWMEDSTGTTKIVEKNFALGVKYFAFEVVEKKLEGLGF
ncbi:MAG: Glycosyl transferase group 1 [Candidatus Woesebacteria bacterium GW2011_GWA1_43_12]|uniref:Glycosyl transferase group 1 n=1 Tax=Candidatus Woesebacteria bacterium GW2011_GWA1_43_12 TaxID=1618557 RepID=A0A0G1F4V0_9BACT|nr:MAG: Glycosyl transferase group 1 [Candidatus Woesebacteria bacterium GW2011_GWA1_43_12]